MTSLASSTSRAKQCRRYASPVRVIHMHVAFRMPALEQEAIDRYWPITEIQTETLPKAARTLWI